MKPILNLLIALLSLISLQAKAQTMAISPEAAAQDYTNGAIITLKPGNTPGSLMPQVPDLSLNRHNKMSDKENSDALVKYYWSRYLIVVDRLLNNYETSTFSLKREVLDAAQIYHIKPTHILAAIVGEHVFNVDLKDSIQNYAVSARLWLNLFSDEHPFSKIIDCPEMNICKNAPNEYYKWQCYESIWTSKMRGRIACGATEPFKNSNLMITFFNPFLGGKTYGLGQMGPIKMLSLTDIAHEKSKLPLLNIKKQQDVYTAIFDAKSVIHYIAAAAYNSIQVYKKEAQFDMTDNIGLTATLYNLGYELTRAKALKTENDASIKKGLTLKTPQVNYYGWFVNLVEQDLEKQFNAALKK